MFDHRCKNLQGVKITLRLLIELLVQCTLYMTVMTAGEA